MKEGEDMYVYVCVYEKEQSSSIWKITGLKLSVRYSRQLGLKEGDRQRTQELRLILRRGGGKTNGSGRRKTPAKI